MLRTVHLVVFDVDGTLTDTSELDAECFWMAAREILRLPSDHAQWLAEVKHYTDLGILSQHCEAAFGRVITACEIDAVRDRRVALLEAAVLMEEKCIRPMPGAADALSAVRAQSGFAVAIATGCFLASAEFKLRMAGLLEESTPIAGCDDAISREEIMLNAARKSAVVHGLDFSAVTYVGDGTWDVEAARQLGWNFIGVGDGEAAEQLKRAGAETVIPDFKPARVFLDLLVKFANRCH